MDPDLALAFELADVADSLTMASHRDRSLLVAVKADSSPVTEVDRAVERALRAHLARERPDDTVLGEEMGELGGPGGAASGVEAVDPPRRWILDPLDGTKNYLRGVPVWGTLIALERAGFVEVGVVSAPALGRRWWAAAGDGAFADGVPARVSAVGDLSAAYLGYSDLATLDEAGITGPFLEVARACWRTRAFGDFWSHMLVAEGALDVAVEAGPQLWDLAAVQVIVEEAGGRFTDLGGVATPEGGSALSSNGLLHESVLAALGPLGAGVRAG